MISSNAYTVGSAGFTTIVGPSPEPQNVTIQNLQPGRTAAEYARAGYVYLVNQLFTIANNGTVAFAIRTPADGVQFEFYDIESEGSSVYASLIEGATYGTGGTVQAYNIDRTATDSYNSVLTAASAVVGGTVISTEFAIAANQGAAPISSIKVHTLKPNSEYVMQFVDEGGQGAKVHFQLGFTEQFNGLHDVYLNNAAGSAFTLKPNEIVQMLMWPGESIEARAGGSACTVGVITQEQT